MLYNVCFVLQESDILFTWYLISEYYWNFMQFAYIRINNGWYIRLINYIVKSISLRYFPNVFDKYVASKESFV